MRSIFAFAFAVFIVHQAEAPSGKELSNQTLWTREFPFDKTLLGLTDFLPHFRGNRVLISVLNVQKQARVPPKEPAFGSQKFMKSIRFRLFVAAVAVMLGGAIAKSQTADATTAPQPTRGHEWGMRGPMMDFPFRELDLTDAQHTQIKEVMQKESSTMKPLMQQLHTMQQQLKTYSEGTYDEAKVQALVTQQSQTLVQLKVQETRIHNEVYQLLTTDQQAKMKEIEATREARMQQHMQSAAPAASEQ
jgi:Spy/CpxP family protein refolding chaperone